MPPINEFDQYLLWTFLGFGILAFLITQFVNAPYGKFSETGLGSSWPKIEGKLGFTLQELPSFVVFTVIFLKSFSRLNWHQTIGGVMFIIHYFHRSIIYTQFRAISLSPSGIHVVLLALLVTSINGYLEAVFLTHSSSSILAQITGFILFWTGFWINYQSDEILINLRRVKRDKYLIPHGGFFEYVSCANYFGESLEWFGYALFCNNRAAWIFWIFTLSNLIPRAIAQHKWYKSYFGNDYPKSRRAFLPFVF